MTRFKTRFIVTFVTLFIIAYVLTGCKGGGGGDASNGTPPNPAEAATQVTAANTALENQDIAAAQANFQAALAADPGNKDANAGYAMTEALMLIDDPDVASIISRWDGYAPTAQNIVYSAVTNSFQVYGGNAPYCGTDPAKNGYTKLTTASASSPFNFSGSYSYYMVYTPPFSQVVLDQVNASTGNANGGNSYCRSGNFTGGNMGVDGDGLTVTMGGASINGSVWVVKANAGSTGVTVRTTGTAHANAPARFAKSLSGAAPAQAGAAGSFGPFVDLVAKLPKNKPSLLARAKRALASTPANAPTISEMQTVIDNKVIPVLTDMIAKLRVVEGTGFTFTVTPAMTGGSETVNTVLDDGEFYAIDAAMSGLNAFLNILTAYNFDVDYSLVDYDSLSVLNGPSGGAPTATSSAFFTLKSNGAAKMNAALTGLQEAADKAKLCYTFVYDQWGYTGSTNLTPTKNPNDNGLKWHDPSYPASYTTTDDTNIRSALNAAKMALQGQVTLTHAVSNGADTTTLSDGSTTVTLDSSQSSGPNKTDTTVFNAAKFFTSPLDRSDLPTFAYDLPLNTSLSQQYGKPVNGVINGSNVVNCDTYNTTDFPDKTFNGIFPNGIPGMNPMTTLANTVLLDQATWSGYYWSGSLTTDGTSLYVYKNVWNQTSTEKIWKIDATNGAVTQTTTVNLGYTANSISSINRLTVLNGEFWASGYYYDSTQPNPIPHQGVFKINPSTSLAVNAKPLPANTYPEGLATDGTNFYLGIQNWSANIRGVVIFPATGSIPSTLAFATDYTPWNMAYGNGSLWMDGFGGADFSQVNPTTGAAVKAYSGDTGIYFNGKLWSIDSNKLHSFNIP